MMFQNGLTNVGGDDEKAANLLIGDAINNFKTVQSFGHEELVVKQFINLVMPIAEKSKKEALKASFAFGFSQFIVYCIFAALFYFGGKIIEANCTENPATK